MRVCAQGDTFARVQGNREAAQLFERAKLIIELEAMVGWLISDEETDSVSDAQTSCGQQPRFLHVLEPKTGKLAADRRESKEDERQDLQPNR